jgi:hypothetical protein
VSAVVLGLVLFRNFVAKKVLKKNNVLFSTIFTLPKLYKGINLLFGIKLF